MIDSKFLSESGWKDASSRNKIKDNGLLKALAELEKLDEHEHGDSLKVLDDVMKLAGRLKKAEEVAALPVVGKYIADLMRAAESAVREVVKAKAKFEKSKKGKAEAANDNDDDEEEQPALLTTKMVPLLRQVAKGETMHTMLASSGKQLVVLLSRKPIPPAQRKLLAKQLGARGGVRYFTGRCLLESDVTTFVLQAQIDGLAKRIKAALLVQTGLRVKNVCCRGEGG